MNGSTAIHYILYTLKEKLKMIAFCSKQYSCMAGAQDDDYKKFGNVVGAVSGSLSLSLTVHSTVAAVLHISTLV